MMLQRNNFLAASNRPQGRGRLTAIEQSLKAKPARVRQGTSASGHHEGGNIVDIIIFLIVGAIAGWLAGMVVKGGGFGLIGDIVVGVLGAVIAGFLLPAAHINLGAGFVADVIDAFIGAVVLLIILRLIKR